MKRVLSWVVAIVITAVIAAASALAVARWAFDRLVRRDFDALLGARRPAAQTVVTEQMLFGLPDAVRRYLAYSGVVGQPPVQAVHLKQTGTMYLTPDQRGLPLAAEQRFTVDPPGFVWDGTLHLGPLPVVRARDRYLGGTGHMLVKAGALVPVADARGPELDQGSLLRYLSEMIWFPTAWLGDNIAFAPLDAHAARVTLTDRGRTVSGTLHIDDAGRLTSFTARRYRMVGGRYELDDWTAEVLEYGERAGPRLPIRARAVWNLPEGDFTYFDATITGIEIDAATR